MIKVKPYHKKELIEKDAREFTDIIDAKTYVYDLVPSFNFNDKNSYIEINDNGSEVFINHRNWREFMRKMNEIVFAKKKVIKRIAKQILFGY
jgi:hypothetical protein